MLLTDNDRNALEACDENGVTNVGRIFALLDNFVEEGVPAGPILTRRRRCRSGNRALRSFALLQCDDYVSYAQAVEVLQKAEAAAAGSGVWHYRLAAALTHVGRLQEAFDIARRGVEAEPGYPWGWLHYELLAHFGETEAAPGAVQRGLELVPGDAEFLTLERRSGTCDASRKCSFTTFAR